MVRLESDGIGLDAELELNDLHSSMVRLESNYHKDLPYSYYLIYIPVWLD